MKFTKNTSIFKAKGILSIKNFSLILSTDVLHCRVVHVCMINCPETMLSNTVETLPCWMSCFLWCNYLIKKCLRKYMFFLSANVISMFNKNITCEKIKTYSAQNDWVINFTILNLISWLWLGHGKLLLFTLKNHGNLVLLDRFLCLYYSYSCSCQLKRSICSWIWFKQLPQNTDDTLVSFLHKMLLTK